MKALINIHSNKTFWALAALASFLPVFVHGQTGSGDGTTLNNPLNVDSISGLLLGLVVIIRDIGIAVAVIFLIYAGFLFVTAQGDPSKLSKAKSAFLWAVVGTAVLVGAEVLARALKTTVGAL